jgi:hypothetical protein
MGAAQGQINYRCFIGWYFFLRKFNHIFSHKYKYFTVTLQSKKLNCSMFFPLAAITFPFAIISLPYHLHSYPLSFSILVLPAPCLPPGWLSDVVTGFFLKKPLYIFLPHPVAIQDIEAGFNGYS